MNAVTSSSNYDTTNYYKNGTQKRLVRYLCGVMPDDVQELVDSIYLGDTDAVRACIASGADVSHGYVLRTAMGSNPVILDILLDAGMSWGENTIKYVREYLCFFIPQWARNGNAVDMIDWLLAHGLTASELGVQLIINGCVKGLDHLISKGLFDVNKKHAVTPPYGGRRMRYPLTISYYWGCNAYPTMRRYLESKGATKGLVKVTDHVTLS